jgi:predicted dithiol-disulfide oxidoreductase (DUF899 family)
MPDHKTGTREEWQAARDELSKLEAEQAERNREIVEKRRELPWVPVEKEYAFETQEGKKTLAELFDGRSQLLAYNIMYGPDYSKGACPGCTSLGDEFGGSLVHLEHRDVTFVCFSRAPIDRLTPYKERMGWEFPWVSSLGSDFRYDFGAAFTEEQQENGAEYNFRHVDRVAPQREGMSVFVLQGGVVHHTYSTYDRGVEQLMGTFGYLDAAPFGRNEDPERTGAWWQRHDEYEA